MPIRLPPALQVFPTLQRFPALRPRRQAEVPIGCAAAVDARAAQQSVLHLYHDLGVLVFAGATPLQTRRIGDVLRRVVAWGGPGGAVARMSSEHGVGERRREGRLAEADLLKTVDGSIAGVIKPEALQRIASARLGDMLETQISQASPALTTFHILAEKQVTVLGTPRPSSPVLQTASGPRKLPVESFTTMHIDSARGHVVGEARFFAAGTGDYVGAARVDCKLSHHEEAKTTKAAAGQDERRNADGASAERRRAEVLDEVLRPLWQLEREVWAERADILEK